MIELNDGGMFTPEEVADSYSGKITAAGIRGLIRRGILPAMRLGQRKMLVRGEDAVRIFSPIEGGKHAA